jgi:hypothetical protein
MVQKYEFVKIEYELVKMGYELVVTAGKHCQLYSLWSSPICVDEIEKPILLYPLQEVAK